MPKQIIITENQINWIVEDVVNDNDLDLIERIKNGDQRASTQLYEKYSPLFIKIIKNKTDKLNDDEINQIVSNALNRAILKINLFDNLGSFEGWLKRILKNSLVDFIVKKKKGKSNIYYTSEVPDVAVSTDREDFGKNYMDLLYKFKDNLPKRQFEFIEHYLKGYTHQDIAKLMGVSEGTSKWQVSTGIAKFKRWLLKNDLI